MNLFLFQLMTTTMSSFKSLLRSTLRFSQLRWLSIKRSPVVTIMGHVDHGKTTLLDQLRKSQIVKQEFGGITQHIGAFVVSFKNEKVTFIDTPGHAAFSAMRQRGAKVTDIIILVVACEDGLMNQTVESIECAKQNNVPIIVAVNKCDKFLNDVKTLDKRIAAIRGELLIHDVITELDGGDVQLVKISALKGLGVDELKESIVALAETLELEAEINCMAAGHVIESKLDQQKGKLCTVLIERGKISKGTILLAGETSYARVRNLFDENGKQKSQCGPGEPAQVIGWRGEELPASGSLVIEVQSESEAKSVVNKHKLRRFDKKEPSAGERKAVVAGDSGEAATKPKITVILKCDVDGTLGTFLDLLETYDHDQVELDIAHFGVGAITENDFRLASSIQNSIIYGFNVRCLDPKIILEAKRLEIPIKMCNVIYELVDDLKKRLQANVPELERDEDLGRAEVMQEFVIDETRRKKVHVAGCRCTRGQLRRADVFYKLLRNGNVVVSDMEVRTLKHLKDDVKVIDKDQDCGIVFLGHEDLHFEPNDSLICYEKIRYQPKLRWNIKGFE